MTGMDLHAWTTARVLDVERALDENEWPPSQAHGVRRRCEADRRILALHSPVSDGYSFACDGCGYNGSYCPGPVTENISDCPVLLAIAYAHGLTPEILAVLDQAELPRREPAEPGSLGKAVSEVWGAALVSSLRASPVAGPSGKAGEA